MSEPSPPPGLGPAPETNGTSIPPTNGAFSLENILGENHDIVEHPGADTATSNATGWDEEDIETPLAEGYCVECEGEQGCRSQILLN